jgi:hypothetical protein
MVLTTGGRVDFLFSTLFQRSIAIEESVITDNLNNNLIRLDAMTEKGTCTEVATTNEVKDAVEQTSPTDEKIAPKDLIDLNGYNSDDNYEYFRNLNLHSRTKRTEEDSISNKDLISFDMSTPSTPSSESARPGPRLCSVRLQPGSNNILLDNAAHFSSPVLYRRRANVGDPSESEPIVHSGKIRASFVSSSSNHEEHKTLTETEI